MILFEMFTRQDLYIDEEPKEALAKVTRHLMRCHSSGCLDVLNAPDAEFPSLWVTVGQGLEPQEAAPPYVATKPSRSRFSSHQGMLGRRPGGAAILPGDFCKN